LGEVIGDPGPEGDSDDDGVREVAGARGAVAGTRVLGAFVERSRSSCDPTRSQPARSPQRSRTTDAAARFMMPSPWEMGGGPPAFGTSSMECEISQCACCSL